MLEKTLKFVYKMSSLCCVPIIQEYKGKTNEEKREARKKTATKKELKIKRPAFGCLCVLKCLFKLEKSNQ